MRARACLRSLAASIALLLALASHGALDPPARADRFGVPLPNEALVRLGAKRFCGEGHVNAVAFSPDGKWLATSSQLGLVSIWDAATGKLIRELETGDVSNALFFSASGNSLGARSTKGQFRFWQIPSGKPQGFFQRRADAYLEQLLPCPDATHVIAVGDRNKQIVLRGGKDADADCRGIGTEISIELLEYPVGNVVKQLARNDAGSIFSDAALSPDGKLLAVGIRACREARKHLQLIDAIGEGAPDAFETRAAQEALQRLSVRLKNAR